MQAQCGPIIYSARIVRERSMGSHVAVQIGVPLELDFELGNSLA